MAGDRCARAAGRGLGSMRRWRTASLQRSTVGGRPAELDLPGYDALGSEGANINLAIGIKAADPVGGAAPHRCYPCRIEKLA